MPIMSKLFVIALLCNVMQRCVTELDGSKPAAAAATVRILIQAHQLKKR
jgi:hypothetical protein